MLFLRLSGVATGLSWICYFKALELGNVSKVASIDKLSIIFTILFAILFLGESVDTKTLVGAGFIVVGAVVMVAKMILIDTIL